MVEQSAVVNHGLIDSSLLDGAIKETNLEPPMHLVQQAVISQHIKEACIMCLTFRIGSQTPLLPRLGLRAPSHGLQESSDPR